MATKKDCPVDRLNQRAEHLLKSEQWTDCSFLVGEQGVIIKAHKLILAMASPVFEAMFYGLVAEGNHRILIPDIQPETFRDLLKYIYTDNIELESPGSACDLHLAAQKYMLPHLILKCSVYLCRNLTAETVCRTYELALMVEDEKLIDYCAGFIQTETSSILSCEGYLDSSIDTLEKVFAMEPLDISSELDLFMAAETYAEQIQNNMDVSHSDILGQIGVRKLVKKIRFLTLDPTDLAEYPTLTSLLTESELLAILMNTISDNACIPMPDGFTVSREERSWSPSWSWSQSQSQSPSWSSPQLRFPSWSPPSSPSRSS